MSNLPKSDEGYVQLPLFRLDINEELGPAQEISEQNQALKKVAEAQKRGEYVCASCEQGHYYRCQGNGCTMGPKVLRK